jgi:energy-coupling factor transport system ATP-binding protein
MPWQLRGCGTASIIAEHRLHYLRGLADRLIVLEHGKIREDMNAEALGNLTTEGLHDMGLRAMVLEEQMPPAHQSDSERGIRVKAMTIGYGKEPPVIEDFAEDFFRSMINGVVGQNGRGKSTWSFRTPHRSFSPTA